MPRLNHLPVAPLIPPYTMPPVATDLPPSEDTAFARMPTPYVSHALHVLKSEGLRITRARRLVLHLLDVTPEALSAYEIRDRLALEGEKVDTVSVYRIIEVLSRHALVHEVLTSGKVKKCQLADKVCGDDACPHDRPGTPSPTQHSHPPHAHGCHHLLICQQCGRIDEIHCPDVERIASQVEHDSGFKLQRHHLEFVGICPKCLTSGTSAP